MSAFVGFFFTSGGMLAAACICAVWLILRPRSAAAVRLLACAAAFYVVVSIPALPAALDRSLASGYLPFAPGDVPAGPAAIVVLGSGGATVVDWSGNRFAMVDSEAAARVLEAARIFRMMPSAIVISSGGNTTATDTRIPTGDSMRAALVVLGIPPGQLLVETESRNTREEAIVVGRMLRDRQIDRVVLVTTPVHMRRALGTFRAAGIDAAPAMARSSQADLTLSQRWFPSDRGLWYSGQVVHELLGLAYYTARGWFVSDR